MKFPTKVLVCRNDHLGDLLLSLPAIQCLRQALPESEIGLLARPQNLKLLNEFLKEHRILPVYPDMPVERGKWDVVLSLHSGFGLAARFFYNRIPIRVGTYSKLWSFVFFNIGKRQKRSRAAQGEGMYSLELVQQLLLKLNVKMPAEIPTVVLPVGLKEADLATQYLREIGIGDDSKFVVLHPGMAGSALNLHEKQYQEIVEKIFTQVNCLVSVGPSEQDRKIWNHLRRSFPGLKRIEGVELSVLKEIFRKSRAVIAPSTGPLHLAHLVGVPVIGLYSPVQSHHPRRWGPWGGTQKAAVHLPQVDCPGRKACIGEVCREFNCMEKIDWASLILKELDGLK